MADASASAVVDAEAPSATVDAGPGLGLTLDVQASPHTIVRRIKTEKLVASDRAHPGTCDLHVDYPEIEIPTAPLVAARVNNLFAPVTSFDGECETPRTVEGHYLVRSEGFTYLSVEIVATLFQPEQGSPITTRKTVNVSLVGGAEVPLSQVLGKGGIEAAKKQLAPMVERKMKKVDGVVTKEAEDLLMDGFGTDYVLEPDGIRFFSDVARPFRDVAGDGFVIAYSALEPYLRPDSPMRDAWTALPDAGK